MTDDFLQMDKQLARLTQATQAIRPRPDFEARVMQAIWQSATGDWTAALWRIGRYALMASALAAVMSVLFAVHAQSAEDEQQALAYGTVDVEW